MKLNFIITNYKTPELLKLCLKSLRDNVANFDYTAIVVDCETDGRWEEEFKKIIPDLIYLKTEKNVGYPALVNLGLEAQEKGDFVVVLNGDMVIPEGQIERIIEYLRVNKSIGVLGPQLLYFSKKPQDSCFRFYRPLTILFRRSFLGKTKWGKKDLDRFSMKDYDKKEPRKVDWLMGSALFIRREALRQVGLMDCRFFMYFEDVDWCRRFWEAGFDVVFYPKANLYHYHGKVSQKKGFIDIFVNKYTWIHIKSAVSYFLKWGLREPVYHPDQK